MAGPDMENALSERSESNGPPVVTTSERPVGVFDSGVGGVSVLREIRRALPAEDLIYLADSAYTPYGDRPSKVITERSIAMVTLLEREGVKAVVVACNTATGIAVDALRARFAMPIVAIEPAVKPAVARTRSGVVGVLATTQTLASERFSKLVETHAAGVRVVTQPAPGLVEGEGSRRATERLGSSGQWYSCRSPTPCARCQRQLPTPPDKGFRRARR